MHIADVEHDEIHVQPHNSDQGVEITLEEILRNRNGNVRVLHRENSSSVWKSGLVTGKRPGLDWTKTD